MTAVVANEQALPRRTTPHSAATTKWNNHDNYLLHHHHHHPDDDYMFRPIQESDRDRVKQLHEEWFPVVYQDEFYNDLVKERLAGKRLHTCVAVVGGGGCNDDNDNNNNDNDEEMSREVPSDNEIVSCVVGSFVSVTKLSRRMQSMLLPDPRRHRRLFYIMTLGTVTEHRSSGLATAMIQWVESLVQQDPACGGIYLHVITYNTPAIRFYERLGFYRVEEIPDYYDIDGQKYASFLYAKYFNGNRGHRDVFRAVSRAFLSLLRQISYWIPGGSDRHPDKDNFGN